MLATKDLRVAIVHDWLVGGGAEKVVEQLHIMFPDAPIYTSYATDDWRKRLDDKVVTGWLQHFGKLRKFMVLGRIWWFQHIDLSGYDVIISTSGNGEAFAVRKDYIPLKKRLARTLHPPSTTSQLLSPIHINYCHTPTHYYWRHYDAYMARPGFGVFDPLARLGLRLLVGPLRKWDYRAAQRADVVLANSTHIQADIKQYYDRDSIVVFPPVDTDRFLSASSDQKHGFVTGGRLAPMKRTDIIIAAANQLHLPLSVIGTGPEYDKLARMAGPTVNMLGFVPDAELPQHFANANAFIFASYEDFGIAPIEAMAAGTPVIAYTQGGALDYVIPGQTGMFFDQQTTESLVQALQAFKPQEYNSGDIKTAAQAFSVNTFQESMRRVINKVLQ